MVARSCLVCPKLREEYEIALKHEALGYARLIAHKRRHEDAERSPRARQVHHLQMVRKLAAEYEKGVVETHPDVPSA